MNFLVIGRGNLAQDLRAELSKRKILQIETAPDVLIYTRGGSISDTNREIWNTNFEDFRACLCARSSTFVFSSNAALEPWQSYYALTKKDLENQAKMSKTLYAIRVNSLYGIYYKDNCFPNKLLARNPLPYVHEPVKLPTNPIVPTPTKWLAEKVIDYILSCNYRKVISIAPHGSTTPLEWGKLILGEKYTTVSSGMANDRPTTSFVSDIHYKESWLDLWKEYGPSQIGKSFVG